ncbi:apoptosis-stimulating of p53 protein 2-like isoform X1 [Paramormyrops kingsleyae]|uniref:Tumor protein p53 binding protein, 2b n=2 Tax=Paramormyrops kingsleyae TaxID=1676925 RepID=A0A3B3RM16_9TELE|nr:apoptosis-stimulating of p53 protein 2-like isoform X1 [Paramormyrops kingsleyae]
MRYGTKMMPVFLTVYLSNNEQHFTEVPITPQTLCRDVVELCKETGEADCYLAEMWRGSERTVGDSESMLDVLQRWGHQRAEVRFFLRHERAPGRDVGGSRTLEHMAKRNGGKTGTDRRMENGVVAPHIDMTLAELQEMAARQQQQIEAQQQLLASKEQRLRHLKQQEQQRQQQAVEQEKLRRLRENAESQEVKLKAVRSLRGQVEQKRLSNGKLVEEIEQMSSLFQQKQRELVLAVSKVEELSRQLEMLRNGRMDSLHDSQSSVAELDRLYKELQLRNKLNQEQNSKLQEQRERLNKRNLEVAAMDKRVSELRDRLWKKKAALQQKENVPVHTDGHPPQQAGMSRVAAVGPYIQFSTMPRGPLRHELLVKPAYPDGTSTLPMQEAPLKVQARSSPGVPSKPPLGVGSQPAKLADWSSSSTESGGSRGSPAPPRASPDAAFPAEEPDMSKRDGKRARSGATFKAGEAPAASLHHNRSCEDLREMQNGTKAHAKVPPPVPSKPKPKASLPGQSVYGMPTLNTGTFPGKAGSLHLRGPLPSLQSMTLPCKQEAPPAATVRPFTPELPGPKEPSPQPFHKPPTVAASSIYSMYTQQGGKSLQGALPRAQSRVYGKPVIPGGGQQSQSPDGGNQERPLVAETEVDRGGSAVAGEGQEAERIPRPLSPTKLLPFISNPYRHQSDSDLEALRRKLYHAPRPLKKRSSITEPEGPSGPNIQKLLYQKTTLAAMETITTSPFYQPHVEEEAVGGGSSPCNGRISEGVVPSQDSPLGLSSPDPLLVPQNDSDAPPKPPPSPIPNQDGFADVTACFPEDDQQEPSLPPPPPPEALQEEYPPYPPPPYPSTRDQDPLGEDTFSLQPPEVTGQVTLPPGKRTNLRKVGSERIDHGMRVKFNPLALLLDSSLEGEYDLVQRIIYEVEDPSMPNDEGITALHNAVCAGHTEIVKFLVQFGVNVNAADSDGWTPLHCAASCNNVQVCKFLVESGAAVFAATYSDMQTAADKCEEMEDGYAQCSQFLYGVQEKMGIMNRGVVYGLWDYKQQKEDELDFREGDCMTVVRREDEDEVEWWWARCGDEEGYIPRNLLGLYPRIKPRQRSLA